MASRFSKEEVDRYKQIHKEHYASLLRLPDVHTVDVGVKMVKGAPTDQLALRVHTTSKKPTHAVPKAQIEIAGVTIDVIQAPQPVPYVDSNRYATLHGGIQIQTDTALFSEVGTLGVPFHDGVSGSDCLLTAAHVVLGLGLEPFDNINGGSAVSVCQNVPGAGNLAGTVPTAAYLSISRTIDAATCDAAVIIRDTARPANSNIIGFGPDPAVGAPFVGITGLELGEQVSKRGRTTGLTHGLVTGVSAAVNMPYRGHIIAFTDLITITSSTDGIPFSQGGDSGSAIINNGMNLGAILLGGNDQLDYASTIANVQTTLNVTVNPMN